MAVFLGCCCFPLLHLCLYLNLIFFLVFVDMRTRGFGVTLSDGNSFTQDEEQV